MSKEINYDASQYLSSGFEAWKTGPENPDIWRYIMQESWGPNYQGWPQAIEQQGKDGVEPYPLEKVKLWKCYRCLEVINIPEELENTGEHFCQLCWHKMAANATLRGMRNMLIEMGADPKKIDEMWMLDE